MGWTLCGMPISLFDQTRVSLRAATGGRVQTTFLLPLP